MKHRLAIILVLVGVVATVMLTDQPSIYVPILIGFFVLFSLTVFIGVTTIKWNYFLNSINRTQPGKIAFTFDDGPAENTLEILKVLKKHEVKAAFFVIGKNCEANQEILKQVIAEGHIIGNHSFSHQNNIGWASTKKVQAEIETANQAIAKITGVKPTFYRPPFGITNPNIARAIHNTGMKSVGWTIRSFDTVITDTKKLIEKVKPRLNKKGHIVLMHDTCTQSVEALDELLNLCKEKGIEIVNLNDIV